MRYLPKSPDERQEMLAAVGHQQPEDLFSQIPAELRLDRPLKIPDGQSEYDIIDYFRARGGENGDGRASFLGAGSYRHFRPVVIDPLVTLGSMP